MANKKIVIISGYFNPIHVGHLDYIATAKSLGDELWIIVNNDEQVKLKGSVPFQNENDRHQIVQSLKPVDYAIISTDNDCTVINTLKTMHAILHQSGQLIFANGGDRLQGNTPEELFCEQNNIKTIYGVGGRKVQSSSDLIEKASTFNIGEENVK